MIISADKYEIRIFSSTFIIEKVQLENYKEKNLKISDVYYFNDNYLIVFFENIF